jgi:hypothetical protein
MATSFLTYHRLKERGGKPVGGQSLDDIYAFAQEHLLTDQSPRNQGGMALHGSWGISGPKRGVGKGASLDYNEGMTKLACLQRMVL